MEALQKLRADLEAWAGRLSPRERILVTLAGAAVLVFVVSLSAASIGGSISSRESRIEQKTRVLSQVGKLAQGYRQREAERKALEQRLATPQPPLMSYISQTGTRMGVEVNDLRGTGNPGDLAGFTEESVEVSLARIDLPRLAQFVQALERGAGLVKVRRIRLSTRNDDPALVDATLVVSTYQLKSPTPT